MTFIRWIQHRWQAYRYRWAIRRTRSSLVALGFPAPSDLDAIMYGPEWLFQAYLATVEPLPRRQGPSTLPFAAGITSDEAIRQILDRAGH